MMLSSLLTLRNINLSYLYFFIKQFITAIENVKHIYVLFELLNTIFRFFFRIFRSRCRSHNDQILSISKFFCLLLSLGYRFYRKIHYLTREFHVKLRLKTDIALRIASRFVRRFSRAICKRGIPSSGNEFSYRSICPHVRTIQ